MQLQVSGSTGTSDVKVSDMLFINPRLNGNTSVGQPLKANDADGGYYDLNGRYLGKDKQQLGKGLYIKNHKKVIIK